MSESAPSHLQHLSVWLYDALQRLYSATPYRLFKSGRAFPPWHYTLELTRRCNLRCRMCQYIHYLEDTSGKEQREGELTTEEWRRVIDDTGGFSFITFTGGEPLVRTDFMELLAHASRKRHTHYITNATLLDEASAGQSVACAPKRPGGRGLNFIGVSLEGPQEVHDEIRQQPGAFERASNGIKTINALRRDSGKQCPLIHITTVIQQANVHVLHQMPEVVASLGGDVLNLVTETRMHDVDGLGERPYDAIKAEEVTWPRIDRQALETAMDATTAAAKKHHVEVRWPRMPREELLRYYESKLNLTQYACRSPWNAVIIGRTGNVYPCWLYKAGNVRDISVKALWNDEKMRQFRQACRNHLFPVCPGCCFIEYTGEKR